MDIAKNMEGIFFVAVSVACGLIFAVTKKPTITVNVSGPVIAHQVKVPAVIVQAKTNAKAKQS
jgi:hypothetical protein